MPKSMSQCVAAFMRSEEVGRLALASQKRQKIVLDLLTKNDRQTRIKDAKTSTAVMRSSDPITRLDRGRIDEALYRVRGHTTDSTLNAYKTDLRRFGGWLVDSHLLKQDPTSHLRNIKTETPTSKRKPVANDKAGDVLAVADLVHPRDGMTAMLFLYTGLRGAEVVELRWRDLNLKRKSFSALRTKNRDWHDSYIAPPLLDGLLQWRSWVEEKMGQEVDENWYVVPACAYRHDSGHHRMNPEWPIVPTRKQTNAPKRVKQWLAAIGETDLKGRAGHTLRRTAANLVIALPGADIRTAQRFLGHKSVAMTELYLNVDLMAEQLQNALEGLDIAPPVETPDPDQPFE